VYPDVKKRGVPRYQHLTSQLATLQETVAIQQSSLRQLCPEDDVEVPAKRPRPTLIVSPHNLRGLEMRAVLSFYKRGFEHHQERAGKCGPFQVQPPELDQCELLLVLRPDTAELSLCRKILRMYAYYACAAQMCGTKEHADELAHRAQLAARQVFDTPDADIASSFMSLVGFHYHRADMPRCRQYNLLAIEGFRASKLQLSDPLLLLAELFRLLVTQDIEEQSWRLELLSELVHKDEFISQHSDGRAESPMWMIRWGVLCWEHRIWRQTGKCNAPRILRTLADCQAALHRLTGDRAINEALALGVTAACMLTAGQPDAALASVLAFVAHVRALNLQSELPRGTPVFVYGLETALYVAGHFRLAAELEELLQLMRGLSSSMHFCAMLLPAHEATLEKLLLEAASPPSTGVPASPTPLTSLNTDYYSPAWEDPLASLDMSVPSPPYTLLQSAYE
jgi:hypothetical protein